LGLPRCGRSKEEEGGELAQPVAANDDDDLTPLLAANENGRHAAVYGCPTRNGISPRVV
jgi:hypothetical protein